MVGRYEESLLDVLDFNLPSKCELFCKSFFDIKCFVAFGCHKKLARLLLLMIIPVLVCCCCCCLARSSNCRDAAWRMCCACGESEADDGQRNENKLAHRRQKTGVQGRQLASALGLPQQQLPQNNKPDMLSSYSFSRRRPSFTLIGSQPRPIASVGSPACRDINEDTRAESSRRGLRRHSQQQAFLNIDPEQSAGCSDQARLTGLVSTGPAFSLRGNLMRSRGSPEQEASGAKPLLEFSLAPFDALQYWRCRSSSPVPGYCRLEVLSPPTKINRAFFNMRLDAPHKLACVTAAPKYPCLNASSAPCSQAGADSSRSEKFGLAWTVEQGFREDLGC